MKLLTKTSYSYALITLLMLVISGVVFYALIYRLLDEEINDSLELDKKLILEYVAAYDTLPASSPLSNKGLIFQQVSKAYEFNLDTFLISPLQDEFLPYRQYGFPVTTSTETYQATLQLPLIEKDDLLEIIAISLGVFTLCLLAILLVVNRWLSHKIWYPFHQILKQLKALDFTKHNQVKFPDSTTLEFNQLSEEITKMTNRLQTQYQNVKEFSENASHEIQTPVSIIRTKLELLMQSGTYTADHAQLLQDAYSASIRISKLTQSLLLLSKIENRQYPNTEKISLRNVISDFVSNLQEVIQAKYLHIDFKPGMDIQLEMNTYLAEILVSNIIGNAIKHSRSKSEVRIEIYPGLLQVANQGEVLNISPDQLFNRFTKASVTSDSPGLGLAIAKEICILYCYNLTYQYENGWHQINLRFVPQDFSRISL